MSDQEFKDAMASLKDEQQRCMRCGSHALDTGWECTDCGFDNMPTYYPQGVGQPLFKTCPHCGEQTCTANKLCDCCAKNTEAQ